MTRFVADCGALAQEEHLKKVLGGAERPSSWSLTSNLFKDVGSLARSSGERDRPLRASGAEAYCIRMLIQRGEDG